MSSYRKQAAENRNALFASSGGGGSSGPARDATRRTASTSSRPKPMGSPGRNQIGKRRTNHLVTTLMGVAKEEKMKEAEEYRKKAKKALQRTLFASPDPIAGAMFYNRAAEAYKLCGENRLERLHRIASGDCQMGHDAYATAASEYMRAAELSEVSDEKEDRKRAECSKLYSDAAKAWREANEMGRSAECVLKSSFSLLIGLDDDDDMVGGSRLTKMSRDALAAIESAVETHVPDPLNRYKHFRQTGTSAFIDPQEAVEGPNHVFDEATLDICRHHMVKSHFAHETLSEAIQRFVEYGEYKSALYAAGAVSAIMESDGFSTISLSRAFCVETILTLAVGDVIAADKNFINVHLQNNNYLTSRECKLAEDLIRAIKSRDEDDLETARDTDGENRAALTNLGFAIWNVVANLRVSGVAKTKTMESSKPKAVPVPPAPVPASAQVSSSNAAPATFPVSASATGGNALQNELDDLMNSMGLDDNIEHEEDEDDDDEIDLR